MKVSFDIAAFLIIPLIDLRKIVDRRNLAPKIKNP
jgi:hypothetical protein